MNQLRFKTSLFLEKLFNWEYWPFELVYFPVFIYYLWLSLKARSLFYFSASNPSILTGGMSGESKGKILEVIPDDYKAFTLFIPKGTSIEDLINNITVNKLTYPVIAKPDVGERGKLVEKIKDQEELKAYHQKNNIDFLIQEYIDYEIELGIFYYRFPDSESGIVSSVTKKGFLHVQGDGKSTLLELMKALPRAGFQIERLSKKIDTSIVPLKDETLLLEPIGNHCRGTTFLNENSIIDKQLNLTIDNISKKIPGFYYGRYDLRCKSIEDLKEGRNIKILELNGAGAEPSHIYHPGASIIEAYKVLFTHWKIMYQISIQNNKNGTPFLKFKEGKEIFLRN